MNADFLDALRQIEKEKDIPFEVLLETIESALVHAYKKTYDTAADVHVRVASAKTGFKVYCEKEIVETIEDEHSQIALEAARKLEPDALIGQFIEVEVTPENFGRIAAQTAKQVVVQRLREAEREHVYDEYGERIGEILTGTVQRREHGNIFVNIGKIEAVLPPTEQVTTEPYNFNDRIKVYILDVRRTPKGPQVIVSRTHPSLIRRLFELEVPEIAEAIVVIKSVAREPGARTKIAVESTEERVDPVGACVGHRGSRVQSGVSELYDEKIDIVHWHPEAGKFVGEALSPAKVIGVKIDEETKTASVTVMDNQLSLAIGKAGQNVRLAARLTGWRIDIRSETQLAREALAIAEPVPEIVILDETEPLPSVAEPVEAVELPVEVAAAEDIADPPVEESPKDSASEGESGERKPLKAAKARKKPAK